MNTVSASLNLFQRTMLHWNEQHAYNAVHVVRVPTVLDFKQVCSTVTEELLASGVASLQYSPGWKTYRYGGTPVDCEIRELACGADLQKALLTEIQCQLNRSFCLHPKQTFCPFRFFTLTEESAFFLGLAYFHPIADAEAIVHLLRRIVMSIISGVRSEIALELYPARRDRLWLQPVALLTKLICLPAQIRQQRRSFRATYRDAGDADNGFDLVSLGRDEWLAVLHAAKTWSVTVNDLCLALLLKSLSPLATGRFDSKGRRLLSAGCVVNTRRDFGIDGLRTFGLFLGSFVVSHEVPEGQSLRSLAQAIKSQTSRIKCHRLYLGAAMDMAIALRAFRFFSTTRRRKLYLRNYPLWGGITNMNLNSLWPQPSGKPAVDYFRAVSTGPVTPLVLSITSLGGCAHIGLTFRTTVFSPAEISSFKEHLGRFVRELLQ